jgi:hypothetical protein
MSKSKDLAPKARAFFIEKCKDVMHKYLEKRDMLITYVRGSTPRFYGAKPTKEEYEQIREMLNVAPDLTPDGYISLLRVIGRTPGAATNVKLQMSCTVDKEEAKKKFLTARSCWKSRRQPRIGTVVAFKKKGQIYVGWSMCRRNDRFDRYIGVYEALRMDELGEYISAFPIESSQDDTIINMITRSERIIAEHRKMKMKSGGPIVFVMTDKLNGQSPPRVIAMDNPAPITPIPHTILPHVKAMVERAKRQFKK